MGGLVLKDMKTRKVWVLETDQDRTEHLSTGLRAPWEWNMLVATNKNKNKTKKHCQTYNS